LEPSLNFGFSLPSSGGVIESQGAVGFGGRLNLKFARWGLGKSLGFSVLYQSYGQTYGASTGSGTQLGALMFYEFPL